MMHTKYPSSWGNLIPVEENKCPNISGIYRNYGEKAEGIAKYRLSEILDLKDKLEETHVQIEQLKDGTFEISGWDMVGDEQKLVYKKCYPKRNYTCTSEGIKASSHTKGVARFEGLGTFGIDSASFYLTKNTDGDLVAKETATAAGLSVVIPMPLIGFGTNWYRFSHEDLKEE